ncbi:MAG: RNA-binding transcriptional accessory protein [Comamonadaceae bacterium CG1_02_60_18]|nr:MAG: RNA-binding transcriptional accessory protein [Comamonadaceae bacterium CG1_02_60_18]PIQ54796.1 MAG: RNA-binding transcriptional accessory protein [Comamonadaceae bacterium CG12_big_fil_rev_8_21_14_0_65_59_15]
MSLIISTISRELGVKPQQVAAAVALLDDGATVPFVARYRKEATGGLDDVQLRQLDARLVYLRELAERRATVLQAIQAQGKLTDTLRAAIDAADTKQALEDLYLPYKLKRRTKGQLAREAGLEPLADALWADPTLVPADQAQRYLRPAVAQAEPGSDALPDFSTVAAVLDGVRDLLSERWAELPALVQALRDWLWQDGLLRSRLRDGKNETDTEVAKFRDYFDASEPICRVPSHRALAMLRGRALDVLDVRLEPPEPLLAEARVAQLLGWQHRGRAADDLLRKCVAWTWRVKLALSFERDLLTRLRESAEGVAIKVFADNLRDLLLGAPAGARVVLGLDPGIRTGVKVAVVDATGKLVDTATVYPHEPRRDWDGALHTLAQLCERHGVNLIAIGNGTASRETDRLAADLISLMRKAAIARVDQTPIAIEKIVVSEAGASVYSASALASEEMPDVDVSLRGAASIARRLQDPLSELVKIDPKSIGVGQYQHDVNQAALARTLDAVVEDCVNAVGVDLNTASVPLLTKVSGMSASVARAVVRWRDAHGAFSQRQELLQVSGLGPKAFEQCAGFLRIRDGANPLDMTGVHPETYPLVERIIAHTGKSVTELMGRAEMLRALRPELFANEQFGVITVRDILTELEKPGRDPRPDFRVARYNDAVQDIADLKEGMVLQGTVSNVAAFGAFVDLGVHQDGLVHVSQLADKFVKDAREVVKTGDIVNVRVLEVDVPRKRISLSMKFGATQARSDFVADNRFQAPTQRQGRAGQALAPHAPQSTAMSSAFAKLQLGGKSSR